MFSVRKKNTNLFLPKTPYTSEEMKNNYITTKGERVAVFKYSKIAQNIIRDLDLNSFEVVEVEVKIIVK